MICVSSKIASRIIHSHSSIDMVSIELLSFPNLIISCVYIPPNCPSQYLTAVLHSIEEIFLLNKRLIVVGDFNAPDIEWSTLSASTSSSSMLCDLIFHLNLTQLIAEPTQVKGNILDLLITNIESYINNIVIETCSSALSSDHSIITFDIAATYSFKKTTRYVFDFSKCDFNGLNDYLLDIDSTSSFVCDNVNSSWQLFKSIILEAI